ncbi:MAG TPA: hypothetical protein VMZ50_09035 [Phycisphaerae bacterium]|nr:hypothetical protein [Phycisphaerae bacterium]
MRRCNSSQPTIAELRRRLEAAEADALRRFRAGEPLTSLIAWAHVAHGSMRRLLIDRMGGDAYRRQCATNRLAASRRALTTRNVRPWTGADVAAVRGHYKRDLTAHEIGRRIGRAAHQVHAKARLLGLSRNHAIARPGFAAFLRRRNADGWSDTEIAAAWGADRHAVSNARRRLGLPSNATGPRARAKIAAAQKRQCARAGVASLAELKARRFADAAARCGWPADLRPRSVQILNALWDLGPMTRRQIAEAVGMPWKGSRASLSSNDPEGSYLAHLMARGLVIRLGRVGGAIGAAGRPSCVCVYSLSPLIERSTPHDGQTPESQRAGGPDRSRGDAAVAG